VAVVAIVSPFVSTTDAMNCRVSPTASDTLGGWTTSAATSGAGPTVASEQARRMTPINRGGVMTRTSPRYPLPLSSVVLRALTAIIVPEGLLLLAAAVLVAWPSLLSPATSVLPFVPPIVLLTGLVLAARFGRTAAIGALLAIGAAGLALAWAQAAEAVGQPTGPLQPLIALLLPLNLVVFALLPERGLASGAAARRAAALLLQAALLAVVARLPAADVPFWLTAKTLSEGVVPSRAPAGDLALGIGTGGVVLLAFVLARRPAPLLRGFLWALVAVLLAVSLPLGSDRIGAPGPAVLFTTAGLILVVALIEMAHALAYRDALTGLPSRRALDEAMRRLPGPAAVAMVDVDHFKALNDTHGHDVGDQVLRMIGTQLATPGGGGRAFRYGGEEFAVLFPGGSTAAARPVLEDLRERVAASSFTLRGPDRPRRRPKQPKRRRSATQISVTVSIGVAERSTADSPPAALLREADEALYRAKSRGRNRVEVPRRGRRS